MRWRKRRTSRYVYCWAARSARPPGAGSPFDHALRGGHLDNVEHFRLSYRMGYRTAKLYLREVRRRRGILDFPMRARFRQKTIW